MIEFNAKQETVEHAALSCANNLAKLFGSVEAAIEAITQDPEGMAEIAMAAFIKQQRAMTLAVHMNPQPFAKLVLNKIQ